MRYFFWVLCGVLASPLLWADAVITTDNNLPGWDTNIGLFAAGRIGDSALNKNSTYEISVGRNASVNGGSTQGQYTWQNGVWQNFSLNYDGNTLTFDINGTQVSYAGLTSGSLQKPLNALAITVSAKGNDSLGFRSMTLNNQAVPDFQQNTGGPANQRNHLYLSEYGDLAASFLLMGQIRWAWQGQPKNSQIAFNIAGANAPANVPIDSPSALLLMLLVLAGLYRHRAKKYHSL